MGMISFGKSFSTVEWGESHFALDIISKGTVAPMGLLSYIPWAFPLLKSLPGNPFKEFINWARQLLKERQKVSILLV